MSRKLKISLPYISYCGICFGHNHWSSHFKKCNICKIQHNDYIQKEIQKWNKTQKCSCGCGSPPPFGKKFVNGHSIRSKDHREKINKAWSVDVERKLNYSKRMKTKNPMFQEKTRMKLVQTNMNRYGIPNAGGSDQSVEKIKNTKMSKYGNERYCNSDQIKKRIIERKKSGEFDLSIKKFKQTCMDRYGVDNPNKVPEIKQKGTNTYTSRLSDGRYHTKNNFKTGYFQKKNGNSEWYDSSLEQKRMIELDSKNLEWTKKHRIKIPYIKNGVKTYYVPDFLILENDKFVMEEIKGWLKDFDIEKAHVAIEYCKKIGIEYRFLLGSELIYIAELSWVPNE